MRCQVDAGGFALTVDEPLSAGGTDAGPQPTDVLLASVASCFVLAIAWAAGKRGIELPGDLQVTAHGHYAGPRFDAITVEVASSAADLDQLVERAKGVCYVTNTLRTPPELTFRVVRPGG
jgi:organic hydroperoxide reductase OsmC/OhrA